MIKFLRDHESDELFGDTVGRSRRSRVLSKPEQFSKPALRTVNERITGIPKNTRDCCWTPTVLHNHALHVLVSFNTAERLLN